MVKPQETLVRLRQLPEFHRKVIIWAITLIIGIGLLIWWVPHTREQFLNYQGPSIEEQLQIPELQNQLQNIPVQFPDIEIPEQELQEFQQALEKESQESDGE